MRATQTPLPGVLVLEPRAFGDERGWFFESFNQREFNEATQTRTTFVQDNHSLSRRGYQVRQPQGRLVRVIEGRVFDVAVDLRRSSSHFGRWAGFELSAENRLMLWIPPGFAHGFQVLSDTAGFAYKATEYYSAEFKRSILWNDPAIGIAWPAAGDALLSERDRAGARLAGAEVYP
jgi:dTDP-4-dehydrorhamnose 3,5-epimerase